MPLVLPNSIAFSILTFLVLFPNCNLACYYLGIRIKSTRYIHSTRAKVKLTYVRLPSGPGGEFTPNLGSNNTYRPVDLHTIILPTSTSTTSTT